MNEVMLVIKQLQAVITHQETMLFNTIKLKVPKGRSREFEYRMGNMRNVEVLILL